MDNSNNGLSVSKAILILFRYIWFLILATVLVTIIQQAMNLEKVQPLLNGMATVLAFISLVLWYNNKKIYIISRSEFNLKNTSLNSIFIITVLSITFQVIMVNIVDFIHIVIPGAPEESVKLSVDIRNNINYISAIIVGVIISPIVEEVIFRGTILKALLHRYSKEKAIFLSALIFGICHPNPRQFILATLFGILQGWIYYKTKSMFLCILMHAFSNSTVYLCLLFVHRDINAQLNIPMYVSICSVILLIVSVILLGKLFSDDKHNLKNTYTSDH